MSQQQGKPRMTYAEFVAQQKAPKGFQEGTVAWLIEKYIVEKSQPGRRQIGTSQRYTLRLLQGFPIGKKQAAQLKPQDYIDHCAARIAGVYGRDPVKPATTKQDITFLNVVLRYAEEAWEMDGIGLKAYKKARRRLEAEQLTGKGEKRTRLPTDEELDLLRAFFAERNKNARTKVDMLLMLEAELKTGRRVSELTRIERQHVNVEKRTCMVFNLKNSKGKGFHAEFALIEGAWEIFEERLRVIPADPTARLFPYVTQTVVSNYVEAKKRLNEAHPKLFKNLRQHDNRAECFVTLLEKGYSETQVQKGVSLHKGDGKVLRETYLRVKAIDLHKGPAARLAQEQGLRS